MRIKQKGLFHSINIVVTANITGHKIFEIDADIEVAIKCYNLFKENYRGEYSDNELNVEIEAY